jgi:hypothetical protein
MPALVALTLDVKVPVAAGVPEMRPVAALGGAAVLAAAAFAGAEVAHVVADWISPPPLSYTPLVESIRLTNPG